MKYSILLTIASLASATPLAKRQAETINEPILHFFVFGDSYSSIGFNITSPEPSLAEPLGFPPLGTSPDDLLGNPLISSCLPGPDCNNQTTANGPNWVEYLTAKWNTSTTLTYDFATSGASIPDGYSDQVLNVYEPKYASLFNGTYGGATNNTQPQNGSMQTATQPGNWNSNSSIFASWVGINDINWCSLLFTSTPNVTFQECMPPRMDLYFTLMENLYLTGARNFFFINMPPLQRAPMVFEHGQTIIDNYAQGVQLFNSELLPSYVKNFTQSHQGVKSIIYDAHSFFTKILDDPRAYGFRDNTCYSCIGCYNVTGCFWTNNYHPNTQVHERLSMDMLTNLTTIGWPV